MLRLPGYLTGGLYPLRWNRQCQVKHFAFTIQVAGEPMGKAFGINNERNSFDKLLPRIYIILKDD